MKKLLFVFLFAGILGGVQVQAQMYENAVGLRASWGFGATIKHFFNESSAVEGIINYRNFGNFAFDYNYIQITGLYEVHNDLSSVIDGLQWYYGGGAFIGFYGGEFGGAVDFDGTQIGIAGVLGLDYAFTDIPLNLSLDWIPSIAFSGGGGFSGEVGGFAIRYIF